MVDEVKLKQHTLINAPAGSGKTYRIKEDLLRYISRYPDDKILCITFTNRAVEELGKGVNSQNICICTIHSFVNNLISSLFKRREIIDLFFEIYEKKINERIADLKREESNQKYLDKFGSLTIECMKQNTNCLYYNETQYSHYYYGGLGHDDLLSFAELVLIRYPKINQKISRKYKMILIDEYQDTPIEVLRIIVNALDKTDVKLFLYGDRMQQIYKPYNKELKKILSLFKLEDKEIINHRSVPMIIDILNNLYNNSKVTQQYGQELLYEKPDFTPQVIIIPAKEMDTKINELVKADQQTLVLYIFNRERFNRNGAGQLFSEYSKLSCYKIGKYSVSDILLNSDEDENPDSLLRILLVIYKCHLFWKDMNYGRIISLCKKNKLIFTEKTTYLKDTTTKKELNLLWSNLFRQYEVDECTIGEIITLMISMGILTEKIVEEIMQDNIYNEIFGVKLKEFINLQISNENPNVSTQHGVKGESHNSVVFVAEESKRYNPKVYMYDFFRLWSEIDLSLELFEDFCVDYAEYIKEININQMTEADIDTKCKEVLLRYDSNVIFNKIYKQTYEEYLLLKKKTKESRKKLFSDNNVLNILKAFQLFYVGCSRAKKNLTILVDEDLVKEYKDKIVKKFENVGFIVNPDDNKMTI